MRKLLKLELTVPEGGDREALGLWLAECAPQGWEEFETNGGVLFRVFFDDFPPGRALVEDVARRWPEVGTAAEEIEEEDWGAAWMEFFNPIEVGGTYEILPPWLEESAGTERTTIIIEPKMAFGTGHHATTALCMEVFSDWIAEGGIAEGLRFLDLGTGSGILGISLCCFGCRGVGLDIDPQAVFCASENTARNKVSEAFPLAVGSLDSLRPGLRFDLIAANILAGPLIAMAGRMVSHLAEGGRMVLSGILTDQAGRVAEAYVSRGLGAPEVRESGEWAALVWK